MELLYPRAPEGAWKDCPAKAEAREEEDPLGREMRKREVSSRRFCPHVAEREISGFECEGPNDAETNTRGRAPRKCVP